MAEKILNTRILLKYDTLENWNKSEGYLRAGEVAIATYGIEADVNSNTNDANHKLGNPGAIPQVLVKVGDGKHKFADLPYITAKAGDVYAWAKKANLDYADLPATLQTAISNYDTRLKTLEGFMTGNEGTVEQAINNAIAAALEGLDSEVSGEGKVVTEVVQENGKVTVTKGNLAVADLTDGTALKQAVENLKTTAGNYATKAELNTAKGELSGEIDSDIAAARELISAEIDGDIATAKTELVGAAGTQNTILWAKAAADNALTVANGKVAQDAYNTKIGQIDEKDAKQDERLGALEVQITGLSGAMHFEGVKDALPEGEALAEYANGDVIIVGNKEYVFNNGAFVEFGDAEVNAGAIANLTTRVKAIEDAPYATEEYVGTEITKAIEALDGKVEGEGDVIVAVTETDGIVTATKGKLAIANLTDGDRVGAVETVAGNAKTAAENAQKEVEALEKLVGEKADKSTADTAFGRIAKAQGEVDDLEKLVGDAADTKDDATVYGAIAAEKARAEKAEGNLQTQINTINQNKTTVSTTKDAGLVVTPNGNDYKVDIDNAVTFIFNCGTSANLDATPSVTV